MRISWAGAAAAIMAATAARGEVLDAQPTGFTVREEAIIAAPPERVWRALGHPEAWWDSAHTLSRDARNLRLELKADGCWCETFPDGGGVIHMRVARVRPGREAVLVGGLGPLQPLGVSAAMTWSLAPASGGSRITWTYDVGGHAPKGLQELAAPVDSVLGAQLARLRAYAEAPRP